MAEPPETVLSPIFERNEIEAMRDSYETRVTQIRPIPAGSLAEWEVLKADVKKRAMYGFGLDPLPDRIPLHIVYGDRREYEDCVVTKIMYPSFPGLYATAFLSVPKGVEFPVPGLIYLQGHFDASGAGYDVMSPMARRGYVGLMILTVHDRALPIGLTTRGVQLWNNIRGLDVLCSLPEVDGTRIGAYGSSGGGMQSMDLAAMDDRVKAVVPVSYPTAYQGTFYAPGSVAPCSCNEGPLAALQYMDNHWFLAMIAPRPLAVMCVTGDWTRNSIDRELPMIATIYDLHRDAAKGPSLTEGREGHHVLITSDNHRFLGERFQSSHAQAREMYVRAFWWFDWWLKDERLETCDLAGHPYIGDYGNLSAAFRPQDGHGNTKSMNCAPPPGALTWSTGSLMKAMAGKRRRERAAFSDRAGLLKWQQAARSRFAGLIGEAETRTNAGLHSLTVGVTNSDGWRIERLWFSSDPEIRIPAFLITRANSPAKSPLPATVMLFDKGKHCVFDSPYGDAVEKELSQGRQALLIDQRWCGEWRDDNYVRAWTAKASVYARPECGMAACDARQAASYLLGRSDVNPDRLRIVGHGGSAGFSALIAAALDDRFAEAVCDLAFNDRQNGRKPIYVAGLEFDGTIEDWAALVAPRELTLLNVNPATALKTAEKAYACAGAAEALRSRREGSVPLVNGGFENDTAAWTLLRGEDGIKTVTRPVRCGTNALVLQPQQTVIGKGFPVEPYRDYYVHVHSLTKQTSAAVDLQRGGFTYSGVRLSASDEYRESILHFLAQPGETSCQLILANTGHQPAFFDCIFIEKGLHITPGEIDPQERLTVTSPADLAVGPLKLPRETQEGRYCLGYGPSADAEVVEEDGIKALSVPDAEPYVVIGMPSVAPLRKGCCYRFSLTLRSRAEYCQLLFWNLNRPRRNITTTGEWQTVTWDFFAENDISVLPAVSFSGSHMEIRAASLRPIPQPATPLPCN